MEDYMYIIILILCGVLLIMTYFEDFILFKFLKKTVPIKGKIVGFEQYEIYAACFELIMIEYQDNNKLCWTYARRKKSDKIGDEIIIKIKNCIIVRSEIYRKIDNKICLSIIEILLIVISIKHLIISHCFVFSEIIICLVFLIFLLIAYLGLCYSNFILLQEHFKNH